MLNKCDENKTLYASARYLFTVRCINGKLVLTAVCGTVGLSMVSRVLTPEEVIVFNEDPENLADAARQLCNQWTSGGI